MICPGRSPDINDHNAYNTSKAWPIVELTSAYAASFITELLHNTVALGRHSKPLALCISRAFTLSKREAVDFMPFADARRATSRFRDRSL